MSMCNLHNGGMSVSVLLAILLAASAPVVSAQDIGGGTQSDGKRINSIIPAAPFLMIAPNSRSGGLGDVGTVTAPDANAMHRNQPKYACITNQHGVRLAFTPRLNQLTDHT